MFYMIVLLFCGLLEAFCCFVGGCPAVFARSLGACGHPGVSRDDSAMVVGGFEAAIWTLLDCVSVVSNFLASISWRFI